MQNPSSDSSGAFNCTVKNKVPKGTEAEYFSVNAHEVPCMSFPKSASLLVAIAAAAALTAGAATPGRQQHSKQKYSYAFVTKEGSNTFQNWDGNDSEFSRKGGPDRLYVKKDGKIYVITDTVALGQMTN